tara:strand:- start:711 stop:1769 length:1059 start_codon:yes stop_codon:yes gene_type:complete
MRANIDLQAYNSFGLSVNARYFTCVQTLEDLQEAVSFAKTKSLPMLLLGGGSNVLLRSDFPGLVILMALKGITQTVNTNDKVCVTAASGEHWHGFVERCLALGLHGLENLALIPGCVGAAPMQNIGAYGVEVKDFITEVQVLDIASGAIERMSNAQCAFAYRDSVFKGPLRDQKIVLAVSFELSGSAAPNLSYGALADALADKGEAVTAQDVFDAVCAIRREKLPDPKVLGNAGSFFKNPVLSAADFAKLQQAHPGLPSFAAPGALGERKVPAAWLIEQAGWKGKQQGGAQVYEKQALVIVNRDHATAEDVVGLAMAIIESVHSRFGVVLEPEVQWIPALEKPTNIVGQLAR